MKPTLLGYTGKLMGTGEMAAAIGLPTNAYAQTLLGKGPEDSEEQENAVP